MSAYKNFYEICLRRMKDDQGSTLNGRELRDGNIQSFYNENLADGNLSDEVIDNTLENMGADSDIDHKSIGELIEQVVFDVSPTVSESRSSDYVDQPIPGPVGVVVYKATGNRRFQISAKFVSRNIPEAEKNYRYVNLLRSWLLPAPDSENGVYLPTAPPILRLNGYKNQFFNIPVSVVDLSINYPEDVDYIETDLAMVPIVQSVDVTVIESRSILQQTDLSDGSVSEDDQKSIYDGSGFNITAFKQGKLPGF